MEYLTLAAFCAALLLCILFSLPILWAMLAGLVFFLLYSLLRGHSLRDVLLFSLSGMGSVKNVLLNFLLIGLLTALWRQAGTIPVIVSFAAKAIRPAVFLLMTFLLNCLLSVLTGTAFGTAATMGVICGTIGAPLASAGLHPPEGRRIPPSPQCRLNGSFPVYIAACSGRSALPEHFCPRESLPRHSPVPDSPSFLILENGNTTSIFDNIEHPAFISPVFPITMN